MAAQFLQIHTLTHYPASLLNRDDAGFAKRMPFGGDVRTRISSQCLKRHWRVYDGENSLKSVDAPESIRSRVSFDRFVVQPLVGEGVDERVARVAAQKLADKLLGTEAKREKARKKGKKDNAEDPAENKEDKIVRTAQVTVLGKPELDYLCRIAREAIAAVDGSPDKVEAELDKRTDDKELKKNLKALKAGSLSAGLGAALFGRMVTGDFLADANAAIHVAHAMTVHGQRTESDYFTAIDDLVREEGEQGSGHINTAELTSGLFYGYVVVDVSGLVNNLGDNRELAGDVVQRLVHIVSTVSPGAKKGSTAPYAYSHLVLVEGGKAQPRTLQNAFIEPVKTKGNVVREAYDALHSHIKELDDMYGRNERRAHAGLYTDGRFENRKTLAELAEWARSQVLE
ncbi:MAG: type I-E CRISPR-associated protein Cas7/Cse4/CasC [Vicinamibacterales bacterium]